jgi:hypothetical protein
MIIYVVSIKPFRLKMKNNLEIFNEILILIISYHLIFYTDYLTDENIKSKLGLS